MRRDLQDVHRQLFLYSVFCLCCRFRLQSITISCNRREVRTEHPHTRIFSHTHLRTCTCMAQDQDLICVLPKTFVSSTRHPCLHISVPLHLRLSLPHLQPHQPLRSRCRSRNTAKIHKMTSVALWLIQPLPQVMSPT